MKVYEQLRSIMHISMHHESENQGIMDLSTKATYAGSGFAAFWGLFTVEQWIGIAGLVVGLVALIIRTYFDARENARKNEMHQAKLAQLLASLPEQETSNKE